MGLVLNPDEEKLLAVRARQGDRAAFDQLVSATARRVYSTVYRLTGAVEDARDLTQETFLRAYRGLPGWQPERPFGPWLYRIATHAALDFLRARSGPASSLEDDGEGLAEVERLAEPAAGPEARLLASEAQGEVAVALRRLPPHYRAVLVLRYYHEMSHQEICETLELPLATVKVHLHRARERLARVLHSPLSSAVEGRTGS